MASETWTCCDCGSVQEAQDPAACSSCVLEVIDEAALKEAALHTRVEALEALAWHLRMCRACGEGDVEEDCPRGKQLWEAARLDEGGEHG